MAEKEKTKTGHRLAIAGVVLCIVAVAILNNVSAHFPGLGLWTIWLSILALILAIIFLIQANKGMGLTKTIIVISIVGAILGYIATAYIYPYLTKSATEKAQEVIEEEGDEESGGEGEGDSI